MIERGSGPGSRSEPDGRPLDALTNVTSVALVDVCQGAQRPGRQGKSGPHAPSPPDGTCPLGHVYHARVPAIYLPPFRIDVTSRPPVAPLAPPPGAARPCARPPAGAPAAPRRDRRLRRAGHRPSERGSRRADRRRALVGRGRAAPPRDAWRPAPLRLGSF